MALYLIVAIMIVATLQVAPVGAQTTDLESASELAQKLYDDFGVQSVLNRKRNTYVVGFDKEVDPADIAPALELVLKIPTVEVIEFRGTKVTGEMIAKLSKLPKLRHLTLLNCGINDKDAIGFAGLNKLESLKLSGNPITDAALVHIKPLKHLERLYLDHTKIAGNGFKYLEPLARLSSLDLSFTPITDDSLKVLGRLHSLRELNLGRTAITDQGLAHLSKLYMLSKLIVNGAKTTDAGRTAFREAHSISRIEAEARGSLPENAPDLVIGYQ